MVERNDTSSVEPLLIRVLGEWDSPDDLHLPKTNTAMAGKSPFSVVYTSSNGSVFQPVIFFSRGCILDFQLQNQNKRWKVHPESSCLPHLSAVHL